MMEDFMDEYVNNGTDGGAVTEEVINVETLGEVEATPFFPDGTEAIVMEPDISDLDPVYKPAVHQQQDNRILKNLQNDINDNRLLLQDLKSSINLLKASTSRIERDSRDLSNSISRSNVENNRLNNSLVDLEFRFNEVVTRQEEAEAENNIQGNLVEECGVMVDEKLQISIENLEEKIDQLDKKIARIAKLFDERCKKEDARPPTPPPVAAPPPPAPTVDVNFDAVLSRVDSCIARTDLNDKSIATAWVGLIASLLLIPIAFFLGKFLSM